MIFVDSSVLLDLIGPPSPWSEWSEQRFGEATASVVSNLVVAAEVSRQFSNPGELLAYFDDLVVLLLPLSADIAFRAGQAHAAYRRAGGKREVILADFLIGAHAAALGAALLTRDRQRFASYFPDLTLITPETAHD